MPKTVGEPPLAESRSKVNGWVGDLISFPRLTVDPGELGPGRGERRAAQ